MRTPIPFASVVPGALLLAAFAGVPVPASAQSPDKSNTPLTTPKGESTSPATGIPASSTGRFLVGDPSPDVNLRDQDGRAFQLSVERRTRPCLIVFVRLPQETVDIEAAADGLAATGIKAAIVAPFGRDRVREWVAEPRLPLLTDRASVTARTFGTFDPVTSNPRPGAYLIDTRGRIVWLIAGGLPSGPELVRMTREALEKKGALPQDARVGVGADATDSTGR